MHSLQILVVAVLTSVVFYLVYTVLIRRRKSGNISYQYRVLIALKRRQAGNSRFLAMTHDDQEDLLQKLELQWSELHTKWLSLGSFRGYFSAIDRGLASGSEDEWMIMGHFDLKTYAAYRSFLDTLEREEFRLLRNFYDIRLLLGKLYSNKPVKITGLF